MHKLRNQNNVVENNYKIFLCMNTAAITNMAQIFVLIISKVTSFDLKKNDKDFVWTLKGKFVEKETPTDLCENAGKINKNFKKIL